jgi:hypothetical protein
MQSLSLFILVVLAIGAFDVLQRAISASTGRYRAFRRGVKRRSAPRTDWYVFFSCSSLYGRQVRDQNRLPDSSARPDAMRGIRATTRKRGQRPRAILGLSW